jgi:hypothetical protein
MSKKKAPTTVKAISTTDETPSRRLRDRKKPGEMAEILQNQCDGKQRAPSLSHQRI